MYCVYCNQDHSPETPFNDEHVMPVALGGPGGFTIQVCQKSNSTLGNKVDDRFISLPFVNTDRYFFNLKSHRGKPTIDLSGRSTIDGREHKLEYTIRGGKKTMKIAKATVERTCNPDGTERIQVSGDPADALKILLGHLVAAEQAGKTLKDDEGNVLTRERIEALIKERSVVHQNPSVLIEWDPSAYDTVRFFSKLALGACFYLMGEPFGRSETAEKLRSVIATEKDEDIVMPGMFWPFVDNERESYRFFKIPKAHVLALTPRGGSVFVASLFGGKYTAAIPMEDGLSPSGFVVPKEGHVWKINLRPKRFEESSFADYILKRPWLDPESE